MTAQINDKKITELDLTFVKDFLKIDYDDEDSLVQVLIYGAVSYIQQVLGYNITDEWPVRDDIPTDLTICALMLISHWYVNREVQTAGQLGNEVNFAISALIDVYKKPFKEYGE
jgi:uncharacterized phage protein (predicted DNA packaging)